MPKAHPKPILNTSLPSQFRQIRLELAREPGHPEGDAAIAYVIVAPLDSDGRIDPKLWREHREACRIARLRPDEDDKRGHLVHQTKAAAGRCTMTAKPGPTTSDFILRMNVSCPANTSRSTKPARCTPIA